MGKLPCYKTLDEKEEFFHNGSREINTKKEFDTFWDQLLDWEDKREFRFRGCGEARYRLFNSSQRYWKEKDLARTGLIYHDFIQKMIEHARRWNNRTVTNFFTRNGINFKNALAYLSFMQHNGLPTPLLDFTSSPFTGLYFAVEHPESGPSDDDIDAYCSLYIVNTTNAYFTESISRFNSEITDNADLAIEYEKHLLSHSILFISTDNEFYRALNNFNILNQKGVFFFNAHPEQPIEVVYRDLMNDLKKVLGTEQTKQSNHQGKFAECVNINKNLRPYILKALGKKEINKDFIFPDVQMFTQSVIKEALSDL
ncbi:MAG: FRG domain-containing protein [Saprospiraceae bacterium]|nr:FRG domain-containing protein [Saprospiraceae bacterium]